MSRIAFLPVTEKINVGGRDFIVSALPCGIVRRRLFPLAQQIADLGTDPAAVSGVMDELLDLVHLSLSGPDPSLTREDLDEGLMLIDQMELFRAVCQISGGGRKQEAPTTGEA